MHDIITLAVFTPAEAERIAGVNTTLQRDWRRRGYLPANDGHARFDVFQLARMLALRVLADRGIGPAASTDAADWCAAAISWAALGWNNAWDGEPEKALTWVERFSTKPAPDPRLIEILRAAAAEDPSITVPTEGSHWGQQVDYLRRRVWRHVSRPQVVPAPLFIWWADGSHTFAPSVDCALRDMTSDDPRAAGAIIVLDLEALGSQLLDGAGRPFVHIEFEPAETAEPDMEIGPVIPLGSNEPC